MANEVKQLQGADTLIFIRKLSDAGTKNGALIPYQTEGEFDPSRDTDITQTKSGAIATKAALETDLSFSYIMNTSAASDALFDSLLDGDKVEIWVLYHERKNSAGQYFAFYMQGVVSELDNSNDADDNSTVEAKVAVDGTPQRGWTSLPEDVQAQVDYAFAGLGNASSGTAWTGTDAGTNGSVKDGGFTNQAADHAVSAASTGSKASSSTTSSGK